MGLIIIKIIFNCNSNTSRLMDSSRIDTRISNNFTHYFLHFCLAAVPYSKFHRERSEIPGITYHYLQVAFPVVTREFDLAASSGCRRSSWSGSCSAQGSVQRTAWSPCGTTCIDVRTLPRPHQSTWDTFQLAFRGSGISEVRNET